MNFTDALMSVELVLESGAVPLLIGESGIGKTALAIKFCKKNGYYNITIDGNMLKEGEIGGLPTTEEYSVIVDGSEIKRKKTVYAVHTKLLQIDEIKASNPDSKILLFVDEINRCEHAVQQELMNIILNREINGYILPDDVKIVAAMNPSSKYERYSESEYQVVDMDPAQEDRFVWIEMEVDVNSWIEWGMTEGNIHEDVLSFISTFPDYLHTPYSQEMIKATPRSWERVSNTYKVYKNGNKKVPQKIFFNVIKGNVGASIAQEFINFLENAIDPLIMPKKLFSSGIISDELKTAIRRESHTRLYLIARNMLNYILGIENRSKEVSLFSQFLSLYPADLRLGIMKAIKESYPDNLYKDFLDNDSFLELFFSLYREIDG